MLQNPHSSHMAGSSVDSPILNKQDQLSGPNLSRSQVHSCSKNTTQEAPCVTFAELGCLIPFCPSLIQFVLSFGEGKFLDKYPDRKFCASQFQWISASHHRIRNLNKVVKNLYFWFSIQIIFQYFSRREPSQYRL